MINFPRLSQIARDRAALIARVDRTLCRAAAQLSRYHAQLGRRFAFVGGTGLAVAVVAIPFSAAVTNQKTGPAVHVLTPPSTFQEQPVATNDGALYVHQKVMQVTVAKSGAPVIRFVQCRHYAKEHTKLVQVGLTSNGQPMLRFVPGDYCQFASTTTASSGSAARVDVNSVRADNPPPALPAEKVNGVINEAGRLTSYQQYACEKFGPACPVALAIQSAENSRGACEIYHYNSSDGTLDWGYFQINTVHLTRPGLNLRDLLDCKANIDFAYQLFREKGFEAWTTFTSGAYRKFMPRHDFRPALAEAAKQLTFPRPLLRSE